MPDKKNNGVDQNVVRRIAATIRGRESGGGNPAGDYAAHNPKGSARGAYQFTQDTYGRMSQQMGANPSDWSPSAQDNVAYRYIQHILNSNNGDVMSVAPTWYVGKYEPNHLDYIPHPEYGNTATVRQYRDSWMHDYNKMPTAAYVAPHPAVAATLASPQYAALARQMIAQATREGGAHGGGSRRYN